MEFLCTLVVVALCIDNPTDTAKTIASGLWLAILFVNFILEPDQMNVFLLGVRYAFLAIINLIFSYPITYLAMPFVVLLTPASGVVPRWLVWFVTFDATLDAGWKDGYFLQSDGTPYVAPIGWTLFKLRCRWIMRNSAYGFDLWPLGIAYNPDDWVINVCDISNGVLLQFSAITKDGKHFCYTDSSGRKLGWKLWWALDLTTGHLIPASNYDQHNPLPEYDQAKRLMFVFTP